MAFNSTLFLGFVLLVCLIYFVIPKRFQWIILLAASYFFYIYTAGKLVVFLILTTLTTFYTGLAIGKINEFYKKKISDPENQVKGEEKKKLSEKSRKQKSLILTAALLLNFGILIFLKYFNFLSASVFGVFHQFIPGLSTPALNLILPLGISFYTFQSTGYIIDVYRGTILPDRHLGKFALFVSFFPQIIQGPISRYSELAEQLYAPHDFDYTRVKFGLQLILWGLFKKMVIADRMVVMVDTVFKTYTTLPGTTIFLGAILYSLQVYCDFSGGIDIARGVAQILGIDMPENFKRPFFATSISDFWRRWHISLSSWMRDYIFYSISLSKSFTKLGRTARKFLGNYFGKMLPTMLAMLITFTLVGIWHGSSWKFVAYGLYNAFFIVLGIFFDPLLEGLFKKYKVNIKNFSWRFYQMGITFILVGFGRYFSRADSFKTAIRMWLRTFRTFNISDFISGNFLNLGLDTAQVLVLVLSLVVLLVVEIVQERGISLRDWIAQQGLVFRWSLYLVAIFTILIFGVYGMGFNRNSFIYMGF